MSARVLAIVCLLVGAAPAAAQRGAAGDADAREIAAYELTLPTLEKVERALTGMAAALQSDPRVVKRRTLEQQIEALEERDELSDAESERLATLQDEVDALDEAGNPFDLDADQSLDEIEARLRQEPAAMRALGAAGLAPREYVTFLAAFLQASMAHGLRQAGTIKEMPKDINPRNVAFVERHQAAIDAFGQRLRALGTGPGQ